jgi:hypothetical protein
MSGKSPKPPAPPKNTKPGGARSWRDELALLREAVRTVDQLDELHAIADRDGLVAVGHHIGSGALLGASSHSVIPWPVLSGTPGWSSGKSGRLLMGVDVDDLGPVGDMPWDPQAI